MCEILHMSLEVHESPKARFHFPKVRRYFLIRGIVFALLTVWDCILSAPGNLSPYPEMQSITPTTYFDYGVLLVRITTDF